MDAADGTRSHTLLLDQLHWWALLHTQALLCARATSLVMAWLASSGLLPCGTAPAVCMLHTNTQFATRLRSALAHECTQRRPPPADAFSAADVDVAMASIPGVMMWDGEPLRATHLPAAC